jgi:hypothetical protein
MDSFLKLYICLMRSFFFISGESLKHDPTFKGPLGQRSCTDIICLLLFVAFVAAWVAIGIYGKERVVFSVCHTRLCQFEGQIHKQCSPALLDMVLKWLRKLEWCRANGGEGNSEDSTVRGSGTVPLDWLKMNTLHGQHLPGDPVSHPNDLESLATLLWETQILQYSLSLVHE